MTDDTQQTHSEECWRWHLGCAERKVVELTEALAGLLEDTQHSEHNCGDPECPVQFARDVLARASIRD